MNTNNDLQPVISILTELTSKIDSLRPPKKYYRNKDLKTFFGLADNTIISYRDLNIIPFTKLGEIYYYPIAEIDQVLVSNSNYGLFRGKMNR